ncbi:hypothetical protein DFH29DRAFT_762185, partial [Suillus ampliporus]
CPNCLKKFKDALGVMHHLSQPLVSCQQHTTVEFTTAAQILNSLNQRASFESDQSSSHSQSSAHSGRCRTQSPHGFSMDLDLPPAWNLGPNSDEDDMVCHDKEADVENDFLIPDGETLGGGAAGGHFTRFEGAARVHARGLTFLEQFNDDVYADHRNDNWYYPFASFQDWELASFLLSSMLSMAAIDCFLGIELIKALPLSFRTAKELWGCAELLPSGPKWQCHVISTDHPMKLPVHLYWRDPLDCIESLFNNPRFAKDIDLIPECIYTTAERTVRIYGEWMT